LGAEEERMHSVGLCCIKWSLFARHVVSLQERAAIINAHWQGWFSHPPAPAQTFFCKEKYISEEEINRWQQPTTTSATNISGNFPCLTREERQFPTASFSLKFREIESTIG
jgi:hypothetical protein